VVVLLPSRALAATQPGPCSLGAPITWSGASVTAPAASSTVLDVNPGVVGQVEVWYSLNVSDTVAVGKVERLGEYTSGGSLNYYIGAASPNGAETGHVMVSLGSGDHLTVKVGAVAGASSSAYTAAVGYRVVCAADVAQDTGTVTVAGTVTADAGSGTQTVTVTGTTPVSGTVTANQGTPATTTSAWPISCQSGCGSGGGGSGGTVTDPQLNATVQDVGNNLHDDLFVLVGAIAAAALVPTLWKVFLGRRG
jgi:hypothetical protein